MTDSAAPYDPAARDEFDARDRTYLEKLLLATDVILRHGDDPDALNTVFETELHLFRDKIERALLLPGPATA